MDSAPRLKRMFGIEIGTCQRCGGKLKIIASIEDPHVIAKILSAVQRLNANGVFCVFANNDRICARFMPLLTITEAEAAELVGLVHRSIAGAEGFDLAASAYFGTQTGKRIRNVVRHL